MKLRLAPTTQITFGVLGLTLSLIMIAYSFGLLPNEERAALDARATISENLAMQIANLASRNDLAGVKETVDSVQGRNGDVLSIGMRDNSGKLLIASARHAALWGTHDNDKSTPTHVQVPLFDGEKPQGRIELVFKPLSTGENVFGLPSALFGFLGFVTCAGFIGYRFILRRALRELDPGSAVPERVKSAFDTLAEGLLIVDEQGAILLANDAFVQMLQPYKHAIEGAKVVDLPWEFFGKVDQNELPWQTALRTGAPILGTEIGLLCGDGQLRRLSLNATPIADGKEAVRGVIVTCDDMTAMHQMNSQLSETVGELQNSQAKISEQNERLRVLASVDPLTGCLNRRTFFETAQAIIANAQMSCAQTSMLMIDADHFKSVNDRFGHTVGDKVLVGLAAVLKKFCEGRGIVGRYGGEEFCVLISGLFEDETERFAEKIRATVAEIEGWLPDSERVTISIGIFSAGDSRCEIAEYVKRADEALYAAKSGGRNRFVNWKRMHLEKPAPSGHDRRNQQTTSFPSDAKFQEITNQNQLIEYFDAMTGALLGIGKFALAHINVDNFRYFNDCYGRDQADELLEKIGHRIRMRIRASDKLIRLAGDEFLLFINPFDSRERATQILERVFDELKYPFQIQGNELFGSFSMGVSVYPEDGREFEILRKNAEVAMRHAKRAERGKLMFFDDELNQADASRMRAEQLLRLAIRDRKFCCAFQPKIDISSHRIVGFETLVRWRDADGEIHLPGEFIDLAMELGLIDQITNIVLEIALSSIEPLDAVFGSHTSFSINIASQLAAKTEFMLPFARALEESGYSERIILEFTEESFISRGLFQTRVVPVLQDIGVRISIDDFGVGYSSLSTLADISANELKIDRTFISEIHARPRNQSILRAITSIADSLKMTVVAEGVETYEELAYLHGATNIKLVQGFYFSKPLYLNDLSSAKRFFAENGHVASELRPVVATAI
jgi:diguanylate cyclase (GGDEF)-like protein/PAS domain S-box-containing protein